MPQSIDHRRSARHFGPDKTDGPILEHRPITPHKNQPHPHPVRQLIDPARYGRKG